MLLLPTFNAVLQPCTVGPAAFTAHANGHFCGSCQRVVQDFSQSTNPVADLAAARAAAPDGRVCGRFRAAQVQQMPPTKLTLSRRLRWFVVALVLVVGQGLTARQALAQVRKATPAHRPHPATGPKHTVDPPINTQTMVADGMVISEPKRPGDTVYNYVQQMPSFRGGDMGGLVAYIQQQLRRPAGTKNQVLSGRVFVSFTVDKDGLVRDALIVKGLQPSADAEVLRVTRELTGFAAGRQNGQAVAVSMMVRVIIAWE